VIRELPMGRCGEEFATSKKLEMIFNDFFVG
jgi:hypothetical protein